MPEKGGVGKWVRYLIALCVVISIVLPLRPMLDLLIEICDDSSELEERIDHELEKYTEHTNKLIIEQNTDIICNAIKSELKEKLGIPLHECEVKLETEIHSGEIRISKVNIFLFGYSMWQSPADIKSLVLALTGAECEVIAG